jgi:iron complex outermembrane receptor protein
LGEYYFKDEHDYDTWSFYIQDVQQLWDKLNLILGVRYDEYPSTFGGEWNPRVGLVYSPWEETSFKFLCGQAFRTPNPYELYFDDSDTEEPTTKKNPDLEPETIATYEFVWEQKFLERFASTLSVFYYRMDDLITLLNDPADDLDHYVNGEEIEARGMELGLRGELENGIRGHIDFTYARTREKDSDDMLLNSPEYTGNLGLSFPLIKDKAYLAGELNYLYRRLTKDGSYTDDVYLTNLTFSTKNLWRGIEVSASIYNLFDQEYGDPGGTEHLQNEIPQDGRSFQFKISYLF